MKNIKFCLLLFLFTVSIRLSAQEKSYTVEYAATSASGSTGKGNILICTKTSSLYGKLNDKDIQQQNTISQERINNDVYIKSNKKAYVYKDVNRNFMISDEKIFLDTYIVKDVNSVFKWELLNETKEILGHLCKKARTNFRGRSYEAYYAEDLEYPFGPWKFSGLPGLILQVTADDHFIRYDAVEILQSDKMVVNPYQDNSNQIEFNTFKELYIKKYKEVTAERKMPDGRTVNSEMSKGGKEVYIEF